MKAPGRTTTARLEMERGDDLDSAISTLIANITCCSVDGSKKSIHENILDKDLAISTTRGNSSVTHSTLLMSRVAFGSDRMQIAPNTLPA